MSYRSNEHKKKRKWSEAEEKILQSFQMMRIDMGCKRVDGEVRYRYVNVYGDDQLGYIAYYESYFAPGLDGRKEPEFNEVLFATKIHRTTGDALKDAIPDAARETEAWLKDEDYLDKGE